MIYKRMPTGVLCVLFLFFSIHVNAQLRWEARELSLKPEPSTEKIIADFDFVNAGDHAVTVTSLKSSCGCTTAVLEKKTYQPKERGKVTAIFARGDRKGLQTKQVIVETNDKAESTILLTLRVQLPADVEVDPPFLRWEKGHPTVPKVVTIRAATGQSLKLKWITATKERFIATFDEVVAGIEYHVTVTPSATSNLARGKLEIEAEVSSKDRIIEVEVEVVEPGEVRPATHDHK